MLGHLGRCLSKCFGRWNSQPQLWSWIPKTLKKHFPCLKMAFQLIQTLAISPGWLLKWLCCFPRTAMRERWSDFVRRRNDAAPASVSWAAQGLECGNWEWSRMLRIFRYQIGVWIRKLWPQNPNNFLWGSLGDDEIFMLCLGFGIGMIKTLRLVWCWWSPVHGCRWRWKARCKNHLAGKKTTWDGGFCTNFTSFFQFFPYQIFRSIVMINGPCSVAMMKT